MQEIVTTVLVVLGVLVVTGAAVFLHERSLAKPGGRSAAGGAADAFGNFIDVFDPGQARAARDLKQHENAGPVTKSPEDDEDRPVRLVRDRTGRLVTARVRRPAKPQDPGTTTPAS